MLFAMILAILMGYSEAMRQQSAGVTGRLFCGANPASNVRVKLLDKDTGKSFPYYITRNQIEICSGPDPDDELDAGYTDANGRFELKGDTRELSNIDPQLKIYHSCNKGINVGHSEIAVITPIFLISAVRHQVGPGHPRQIHHQRARAQEDVQLGRREP